MGKSSCYGVNGGPDTKNEIHAPGVSTHARFTRRLGLLFLGRRSPAACGLFGQERQQRTAARVAGILRLQEVVNNNQQFSGRAEGPSEIIRCASAIAAEFNV